MHELVGADGNGRCDTRQQRIVAAGGQRLLDQLDARRGRGRQQQTQVSCGVPGFVGIGDEPRLGHAPRARRAGARRRPAPPSLSLSSG